MFSGMANRIFFFGPANIERPQELGETARFFVNAYPVSPPGVLKGSLARLSVLSMKNGGGLYEAMVLLKRWHWRLKSAKVRIVELRVPRRPGMMES